MIPCHRHLRENPTRASRLVNASMCREGVLWKLCVPLPANLAQCPSSIWLSLSCFLYNNLVT